MTIDTLKRIMESGQFDHATYRNLGTIWEGLYIYVKEDSKIGFTLAGSFNKNDGSIVDQAYELVRSTGVSLGIRGNG